MTGTTGYDKPLPQPTPDTQPYWDGLRKHRLLLQRCAGCGVIRHYPQPVCPACHSMEYDWAEASGKGRIHSWTVSHHAFHPGFKADLPYVIATVDLAEGVRMLGRLRDADGDSIRIDMPVEVVFEDVTEDTTLASFRPAPRS